MAYQILTINPGSTSTKLGLFADLRPVFSLTLRHPTEVIDRYANISDQFDFRKEAILAALQEAGIDLSRLDAVVGRGGFMQPVVCGTYLVNQQMKDDVSHPVKQHASNLGALLADEIAAPLKIPAFVVNPVTVDEMSDLARVSGLCGMERRSYFHALNQKSIAAQVAKDLGREYRQLNMLITHLGGGITTGVHQKGRVVDVNNGTDGDGPMAPERSGALPTGDLVDLCFDSGKSKAEIQKLLSGKGGVVSYCRSNNIQEIMERKQNGDRLAALIIDAMIYQVAKEIGAGATVLKGDVDCIVLTGGLANSQYIIEELKSRVAFIAPVYVYPGENESQAMAEGAFNALTGKEAAKTYPTFISG